MTGHHDPGARGAFPWEHPGSWDGHLLEAFRSLTALRREHPALRRGGYRHLAAEGGTYAFAREFEGECLVVAVNAGGDAGGITVPRAGDAEERLWGRGEARGEGGGLHLELPGRSGAVWRLG